jgi:hypothetical protein
MSAATTWVLLPSGPIRLTGWQDLQKYPLYTLLYDAGDTYAPWGEVSPGMLMATDKYTVMHIWNTIKLNKVPKECQMMALLLT